MKVSVITPTGGRPLAFSLCEGWMRRQTRQPDEWIVVDDCEEPTICTMGQTVIRREPYWKPGDMTLPQNIIAGLEAATGDAILIMEDDDWYSSEYIANMAQMLEKHDMAGEGRAAYYNVRNYRYMIHRNMEHASLCQTGISAAIKSDVLDIVHRNIGQKFLDLNIWRHNCNKSVFFANRWAVGIKGLPGRAGIGYGHKDTMGTVDVAPFRELRKWIGDIDADLYYNAMKSTDKTDV